jgi:hypothetical protein
MLMSRHCTQAVQAVLALHGSTTTVTVTVSVCFHEIIMTMLCVVFTYQPVVSKFDIMMTLLMLCYCFVSDGISMALHAWYNSTWHLHTGGVPLQNE